MKRTTYLLLGAFGLSGLVTFPSMASAVDEPTSPKVEFNRDIRPILSNNCFRCHGPEEKSRRAGLRLDNEQGAFAPLESGGTALVPGKPEESELFLRVSAEDSSERMPPPESGKDLTSEQIALIRRWIEQGAQWQGHWSFIAPTRPALPAVQAASWPRTPIDYFILSRLEAEGLAPSPQADRRTLIRRVSFDLTGLPPEPAEIEAFVNDTSPDAYEELVNRLLNSPHYGEHMARYWLDAVRYGDTHGLHLDNYREMWPYRDWVIGALNRNMPFDQFTIEQLAGDLLPDATLEQQIASGFNRCNVTTSEGGSIAEEVYVRNVVDRVETTSTVFLGLTAGCAVCHNHKFDPLTMKDFYSLFAFFNNLDGDPLDGNRKDDPPVVRVPSAEQQEQLTRLDAQIAETEKQLAARRTEAEADFERWLAEAEAKLGEEPASDDGLVALFALDETEGETVANAVDSEHRGTIQGEVVRVDGKAGKAIQFAADQCVDLGDVAGFERDQRFSYGAWVKTPGNVTGAPIARMDDGNGHRGYDLYIAGRKVAVHLIHHWSDNAVKVTTKEDVLEPNQWHHVFATYDGSSKASGVTVYVDGNPREHAVNVDALSETIVTEVPLQLGKRKSSSAFTGGAVDDVRMYGRCLSTSEVAALAGSDTIRPILAVAREERTAEQQQTLRRHYLDNIDEPFRKLTATKAELQANKTKLEQQLPTTLVFKERAEVKPAYILVRGQYNQHGDPVQRATPEALPPMAEDLPRDRLGFAKWLLSPEHPLMARVTVNRFWQQCFGTGIVKTSEDFGSQGEWPSHPALLDWLAVDFRESGWDVKRLMKMLVMSAAYRQSSRITPALLEKDPQNRLLARGPRYRLDAEMLRDQALAVSGLLVDEIGGPSVKPPQPAGIWEAVGYTASNTAKFQQDTGERVYRRSVYTFWKRTAPPPTMNAFDAPSRESCRVRRERTNTPLQALVMMNEEQFFEAARHLAERAIRDSGGRRLAYIFQRATGRPPDVDETEALLAVYRGCLAEFEADPAAAEKLMNLGETKPGASLDPAELAAWTMVANVVLNLDEVVTKH